VVSLNLVQVYIFWNWLACVRTAGFWYDRKAADAAQKAFVKPRRRLWPAIGNSGSLLGDGSFEFEVMGDRLQDSVQSDPLAIF